VSTTFFNFFHFLFSAFYSKIRPVSNLLLIQAAAGSQKAACAVRLPPFGNVPEYLWLICILSILTVYELPLTTNSQTPL